MAIQTRPAAMPPIAIRHKTQPVKSRFQCFIAVLPKLAGGGRILEGLSTKMASAREIATSQSVGLVCFRGPVQ